MVETQGHTLEAMNDIFRHKSPVKASLIKREQVKETVEKLATGNLS